MSNIDELAAIFLHEGGLGGGSSPSSFRRWLKSKYGVSIGYSRAKNALKRAKHSTEWVIQNKWEALGPEGKVVELRQTKVKLKQTGSLFDAVRAFIQEEVRPVELKAKSHGELLGVLSIPDIHVGKLAWAPETGEAYDTKRAVNTYLDAAGHLIEKLKRAGAGRVLYVVGNDLLHVDGGLLPTTTKGTPQDTDTRWLYAFRRAKAMTASVIKALAEFAEVDVIVVPGNHDNTLATLLGEVLQAYYAHSDGVRVDNRPIGRKYIAVGKLLFGFTHGDTIKPQALPTLMATEVPELWGQTTWREWMLGHIHKRKEWISVGIDDMMGVRLRYLPSLSGMDRWSYSKGYRHAKVAEVHVYDPEEGTQVATYYKRARELG